MNLHGDRRGGKASFMGRKRSVPGSQAIVAVRVIPLQAALNPGSAQVHWEVVLGYQIYNFCFLPGFLNVRAGQKGQRKRNKNPGKVGLYT